MAKTPTYQQLQDGMDTGLRDGLAAMVDLYAGQVMNGPRWPELLARLHAYAFALAEETERLADQLAAYARAHPYGELPADPREVPVAAYDVQAWWEIRAEADIAEVTVDQVLRDRHRAQLAGQGPHTMDITYPDGAQDPQAAIVVFTDAQGRIVLIVYYGLEHEQMAAEFAQRDLMSTPIPYIPSQGDNFMSIAMPGNRRPGLYDRYGRYLSPDRSQEM